MYTGAALGAPVGHSGVALNGVPVGHSVGQTGEALGAALGLDVGVELGAIALKVGKADGVCVSSGHTGDVVGRSGQNGAALGLDVGVALGELVGGIALKVGVADGDPVGLIGVPVGQTGAALGAALGLDVGMVLIVGTVNGVSGHTGDVVGRSWQTGVPVAYTGDSVGE